MIPLRTLPLRLASALTAIVAMFATIVLPASPASAAESPIGLGTVGSFAVLAGTTVTNTGPSVIGGELGVSPGTSVTGFPPGLVVNGTIYANESEAAAAQAALGTAFNDAAGRGPGAAVTDLGGDTLFGGVYTGGALGLTGTLTLDAQGVADTVWIIQAASTLITASASEVVLLNGANPCNVFWLVGSSATLGTGTDFVGTVLAQASITATTGAEVEGRLLARTGAVTLDTNVITLPDCTVPVTTTESTGEETTTTTAAIPAETTTTTEAPAETTTTTEAPAETTTTIAAIPADTTTTTGVAVAGDTTTTTTDVDAQAAATTTTTDGPADGTAVPSVPTVGLPGPNPPTFGSPRNPAAPRVPTTPRAPGTPARPELPKTGGGLATTAGAGVLCLVLGELVIRRSRRLDPTDS
jgi:hypothetical protein